MNKLFAFLGAFAVFFYAIIFLAECAIATDEDQIAAETERSEVFGEVAATEELAGWVPISELRGPCRPKIQVMREMTLVPVNYNPGCSNGQCTPYVQHLPNVVVRNECCAPVYRHWEYQRWQPARNVVRFFHNVQPIRNAIGFVFRGFRCR